MQKEITPGIKKAYFDEKMRPYYYRFSKDVFSIRKKVKASTSYEETKKLLNKAIRLQKLYDITGETHPHIDSLIKEIKSVLPQLI